MRCFAVAVLLSVLVAIAFANPVVQYQLKKRVEGCVDDSGSYYTSGQEIFDSSKCQILKCVITPQNEARFELQRSCPEIKPRSGCRILPGQSTGYYPDCCPKLACDPIPTVKSIPVEVAYPLDAVAVKSVDVPRKPTLVTDAIYPVAYPIYEGKSAIRVYQRPVEVHTKTISAPAVLASYPQQPVEVHTKTISAPAAVTVLRNFPQQPVEVRTKTISAPVLASYPQQPVEVHTKTISAPVAIPSGVKSIDAYGDKYEFN